MTMGYFKSTNYNGSVKKRVEIMRMPEHYQVRVVIQDPKNPFRMWRDFNEFDYNTPELIVKFLRKHGIEDKDIAALKMPGFPVFAHRNPYNCGVVTTAKDENLKEEKQCPDIQDVKDTLQEKKTSLKEHPMILFLKRIYMKLP